MMKLGDKSGRPMTPAEYTDHWKRTADHFASRGHYAWMAEQLQRTGMVLEVGCGSGASTVAIVRRGNSVLSIEALPEAAQAAAELISSNGIPVALIDLAKFKELESVQPGQVLILTADFLDIGSEMQASPLRFDAIVCWLIGAVPEMIATRLQVQDLYFTGNEPSQFRMLVHQRCYEIGAALLKEGGVVQIVDRFGMESWAAKKNYRQQMVEMHRPLASQAFQIEFDTTYVRRLDDGLLSVSAIQYFGIGQTDRVKAMGIVSLRATLLAPGH